MSNYPPGVTDMDEHFDLPSVGDDKPELYGLKLDFYDGQAMDMVVYDGRKPLLLTLEEIQDVQKEYEKRNPKGRYSVVPSEQIQ